MVGTRVSTLIDQFPPGSARSVRVRAEWTRYSSGRNWAADQGGGSRVRILKGQCAIFLCVPHRRRLRCSRRPRPTSQFGGLKPSSPTDDGYPSEWRREYIRNEVLALVSTIRSSSLLVYSSILRDLTLGTTPPTSYRTSHVCLHYSATHQLLLLGPRPGLEAQAGSLGPPRTVSPFASLIQRSLVSC